jgi:hypothetical protein
VHNFTTPDYIDLTYVPKDSLLGKRKRYVEWEVPHQGIIDEYPDRPWLMFNDNMEDVVKSHARNRDFKLPPPPDDGSSPIVAIDPTRCALTPTDQRRRTFT